MDGVTNSPVFLRTHVGPAVPAILMAALWCTAFALYSHALTNNDVAWMLTGTSRWLHGGGLYRDVIEVNPPLVFYFDVPPVLLASATGLPATFLFVVYVFALIAACLLLVNRILTAAVPEAAAERWLLLLGSFTAIAVFPSRDFGQREHLMLILCLPYLVMIGCRALDHQVPRRLAIIVGLAAGIGFDFKPQFLILPVLLEVYLAAGRRWRWDLWRPELLIMALVTAAYAISIPLLAWDYLTRIIPWALLIYGKGYANSVEMVFFTWQTLILPPILGAHLLSRSRQRHPAFADIFLIGAIVFYVIYASEMKGWTYQILPVSALLFLTVVAALASGGRMVFGSVAIVGMLLVPFIKGVYQNPTAEELAPLIKAQASGRGLYVFSSYVWVGFPLVEMVHAHWASRFPCLWLLPGAVRGLESTHPKADPALLRSYAGLERYTTRAVVDDFEHYHPAVVVVDARPDPRFGKTDFQYLPFFERDPAFAQLWSHYVLLTHVGRGALGPYDIYVERSSLHADASARP